MASLECQEALLESAIFHVGCYTAYAAFFLKNTASTRLGIRVLGFLRHSLTLL